MFILLTTKSISTMGKRVARANNWQITNILRENCRRKLRFCLPFTRFVLLRFCCWSFPLRTQTHTPLSPCHRFRIRLLSDSSPMYEYDYVSAVTINSLIHFVFVLFHFIPLLLHIRSTARLDVSMVVSIHFTSPHPLPLLSMEFALMHFPHEVAVIILCFIFDKTSLLKGNVA